MILINMEKKMKKDNEELREQSDDDFGKKIAALVNEWPWKDGIKKFQNNEELKAFTKKLKVIINKK